MNASSGRTLPDSRSANRTKGLIEDPGSASRRAATERFFAARILPVETSATTPAPLRFPKLLVRARSSAAGRKDCEAVFCAGAVEKRESAKIAQNVDRRGTTGSEPRRAGCGASGGA